MCIGYTTYIHVENVCSTKKKKEKMLNTTKEYRNKAHENEKRNIEEAYYLKVFFNLKVF